MNLLALNDELEILKKEKKNTVNHLLNLMRVTDSIEIRNNIGFVLVDHFKDENIELTIIELIKDLRWSEDKGTLIYLLGEASSDQKYLMLLVDLILSNPIGGEVYMGCIDMIIKLEQPFDIPNLKKALNTLKESEESSNTDILGLIKYLEHQLKTSNVINEI